MAGGYVLDLKDLDRTRVDVVGGKAASLGEVCRLADTRVPEGFCLTTAAFRRALRDDPRIDQHLARLERSSDGDPEAARTASAAIRRSLERFAVPGDVTAEIGDAIRELGEGAAFAVRSSATAEDRPTASFAGQHDTFLDIVGPTAIVGHVTRCWASLFTDRAVAYRVRHGLDHRGVAMAVIVQRMVDPDASGVLFTADPVTGHRKAAVVEASIGRGDALVSGRVAPDAYEVRDGEVTARTVAAEPPVPHDAPAEGVEPVSTGPARRTGPVLADAEVIGLTDLGRRIEAHLGRPQDIEWCLDGEGFRILQSRPITTLFPVPDADDHAGHVYVSVGHQQMMTDPMTPLGLSVWQLTSPAPMRVAGGRLFVDVSARLSSPATREATLEALGRSDPLIRDALETVLARGDVIGPRPEGDPGGPQAPGRPPSTGSAPEPLATDPTVVAELIERSEASTAALERAIAGRSGVELLDLVLADLAELKRLLFEPRSHQVIMAGMEARWWLDDHLHEWLGETGAADVLSLAAPGNVTAEMGLAMLDVADVIRPHPQVIALLRQVDDDGFLDELMDLDGGRASRDAIVAFLDRYGMRCVGEIDVMRPRWRERPSALVPAILADVEHFEPGERTRRIDEGRQRAARAERDLLGRLRTLPDGAVKADRTRAMIDRLRTFVGYREYPKYSMVSRYAIYRRALLDEAERLADDGVLDDADDVRFLTLRELHEVVRTNRADAGLIERRRDELRASEALTPPRVLTSDGEALSGAYRRDDLPAGALAGLPASAGVVEGRARVIHEVAEADLEPGDILVTPHTDPSWSPLFVAAAGLVTEVGGMTTHGAVVAREYGLTAVVGVDSATRLIRDGQRIRVDGSRGCVEILTGHPGHPGHPGDPGDHRPRLDRDP